MLLNCSNVRNNYVSLDFVSRRKKNQNINLFVIEQIGTLKYNKCHFSFDKTVMKGR